MQAKQFSKNEQAQVGIGTMIVFIATILVAAVAAGVLIDTSQKLQAKSTQTGDAATQQVGTALEFQTVYGRVSSGEIIRLELWLELSAGADPVNLEQLIVQFQNATATTTFEYENNALAAYAGTLAEFAIYNGTGTTLATDRVLEAGERAMVLIGNDGTSGDSLNLGTSTNVEVRLIPENGVTITKAFQTPNTFNSQTVFEF